MTGRQFVVSKNQKRKVNNVRQVGPWSLGSGMKYGILFAVVAMLLTGAAFVNGGRALLLLWPALSFAIVAGGYLYFGPGVFGKSSQGRLSPLHHLLLLPFLMFEWSIWYALRFVRRELAFHQLTDNILIGRRLLSYEFPGGIDHVIDLTCEFNEPSRLRSSSYHSFAILDAFVPPAETLRDWVQQVAQLKGTVYIHCAEGFGRTGLFAAALLLATGHSPTPEDALHFIQSKRARVRLNHRQWAVLRDCDDLLRRERSITGCNQS